MAKSPALSQGLKHLPEPRPLLPGEIVITRFKNAMRKYRADLWVGIVIPQSFGPSRHLNRRPTKAQPIDGPWPTHLKDRVYPLYLPGLNMYRHSGLQDVFILNKKTPNVFKHAKRHEEAKVWDDLMHIINTYAPALDWWLDMAQQEQGSKGKRGRELRIVLPRGYEHYVNADLNDANADEDEEENESEAESKGNADDDLAKKSAEPETGDASTTSKPQETNEPSASCSTKPAQFSTALGLFFDEHESFAFKYRPYILGQGSITGNLAPSATPQDFSSHTFQQAQWRANDSFPSFDSKSSSGTHEALTKQEHIDGANCEAAKSKTPFDMSVCMAFQHIFLKTEESALLLNAFRDIVNIQHRVEFAKIQSFLTDGEFSPRLISLYNPVSFTSMEAIPHQIGDQSNVGRRYRLEGISNTNDLETAILSLGELYQQARSFELTDLIYLITLKLQVAWNSYPALYHLKPLLKITALIFPNAYDENTHDALQYWMLHFFAETYDLFTYDCPDMFWSVMRANPDLREGVMKLRSGLMTENPMLYSDSQALIRSRGVEKL